MPPTGKLGARLGKGVVVLHVYAEVETVPVEPLHVSSIGAGLLAKTVMEQVERSRLPSPLCLAFADTLPHSLKSQSSDTGAPSTAQW